MSRVKTALSPTGPWFITVVVGILALAALAAAVVLEITHNDADKAWEAFAGLVIFFGGVHVPSPTT